jgi:hypothetical protein
MESSDSEPRKQGRPTKNLQFLQPKLKEKELLEYGQKISNQSNKTLKLIVNVGAISTAAWKSTTPEERFKEEAYFEQRQLSEGARDS